MIQKVGRLTGMSARKRRIIQVWVDLSHHFARLAYMRYTSRWNRCLHYRSFMGTSIAAWDKTRASFSRTGQRDWEMPSCRQAKREERAVHLLAANWEEQYKGNTKDSFLTNQETAFRKLFRLFQRLSSKGLLPYALRRLFAAVSTFSRPY